MSVLIIEDNVSLATLVSMFLTGEGIDNEVVHNGFEGLARLNERAYDVLLTDIRLPKISGMEIFEKAKKHFQTVVDAKPEDPELLESARKELAGE